MTSPLPPNEPGAEQPFVSHLIELRDRLLRMVAAVGIALLLTFPFANDIYSYVAGPLLAALPEGSTMIATQVASPFLTPFKLALMAAVLLAVPYLLYQLWSFVAPGLYQHEKRLAVPLLVSSILLFYLGMLFAYFLVFPLIFGFMAATTPDGVTMMTDISAYLDFVLALFFAFGLAFEVPVATVLMVMTGMTTPNDLAEKRPYVVVGAFVVGMLLTPPDVFSQTMLAIPMWMLFELGIMVSRLLLRDRQAREDAEAKADTESANEQGERQAAPARADRDTVVGRDIDPSDRDDPERWEPLSEEAMEEALDLMDAEELADPRAKPLTDTPVDPRWQRVEEKIERANRLRDLDSHVAARVVLYEVLEEGDETQRRVARNILRQLDDA